MNTKPDHVANSLNVGERIMRALGIDPRRMVSRIVIDIKANNTVEVHVTEGARVGEVEAAAEVISEYMLVPKDDGK